MHTSTPRARQPDEKDLASYTVDKITTNLNADIAGVETKIDTIDDLVDDLETRITAARAGYLDNLSAGAVALEATLTAIKGAGWTDETLVAIQAAIEAVVGGATAAQVWAYANRTLTQAAASVTAAVSGSDITGYSGDTLSLSSYRHWQPNWV